MALAKTSVTIDPKVVEDLKAVYPGMVTSQIVRAGLQYLLAKLPTIDPSLHIEDKAQ